MEPKRSNSGLFFFLLALVLAPPIPANAAKRRDSSVRRGETAQRQSLPVKIYRDFLVVAHGQIAGISGRQNFILDTGTAPTIIAASLVRRLGLATVPSTFTAIGKVIPTQTATIPEIDLGPIHAVSLPVQVQDLSRLERSFGTPIAGIIGLDVLSQSSFRLDYDKKEIEFGANSREGIPVLFDARIGLAIAGVKLGDRTVRMLVDTGSNRVVLLGGNFPESKRLGLRNTAQAGISMAAKDLPVQEFSSPDILFGGQHFSQDRAYFVPESADPVFDGLLGVRALGFRSLSYDKESGTLYLQK